MGGKGKGGQGPSPRKIFGITPFPSKGNALSGIERELQKWHFCSFAEKGRGLKVQDSLSCTPARVTDAQ